MIQRVLTLLLVLSVQLFSAHYDETLLKIEAKLFPKIAILEQNIKLKSSESLTFVIVAEDVDREVAEDFKARILKNYPNKLLSKTVKVSIQSADELLQRDMDALIFLYINEEKAKSLLSWANRHNILTFAYDPSYLELGAIASIYIGKSTKPYINKELVKKYSFEFDSYLLRLSKFKN